MCSALADYARKCVAAGVTLHWRNDTICRECSSSVVQKYIVILSTISIVNELFLLKSNQNIVNLISSCAHLAFKLLLLSHNKNLMFPLFCGIKPLQAVTDFSADELQAFALNLIRT